MGLKLRLDFPEQAMDFISVFFRTSTSASEAAEYAKSLGEQRARNMKVLQEKMNLSQKEVKRFNPIDTFPGDMVIFSRVIGLLRGLSTTLDARIVYHDIMRPFAESVLQEKIAKGPSENAQWINDTPVHSDVEAKLRQILVELGNDDKILGIQVCAYKDGEVIIDTAAGVLGRYDPRPVQPDSLFPVFSVTKGITAGMLHWLVDKGKLNLNENIADIWPEFGTNGKNLIKVHHVLNHTSGLQNALANLREENPLLMDWDECLKRIAMSAPETELVYNDHQVETHFGKRIWVCVSDPFDEITIAKAILEGLNESTRDLNELQALLLRIQESIRGKRFLLVLDDVWNEDSTKWEQLKNSLKRVCLPGSRFLVTTRKRKVANSMGSSSTDILELGLLSPDECWSLFGQFAFYEKNSRERENLEETGRKIAERCKGLPLAAKTLGSLLRFKRSRAEWESVLNNHVWEIKEAESNLLAPLWLSYHDLPTEMRPCFLYCAVFPKDYTIKRDALIKLWMAQGFLRETQNQEMEATGGECFEALAARSFFQDFEKNKDDGSIVECKMHDIVHDFAQWMTKNESFSVEIDGGPAESKIDSFSRDARHSMVVFRYYDTHSFPATIHGFKKLRSLIVDGCPSSMNAALPVLIANLSCLRTLRLPNCRIEEVPSNIGKLIYLRHVDLSYNPIKELPEEMCELYNMQTLNVSECSKLKKLPDNIGKLIKLRHLRVGYRDVSSFVRMRGFEGLGCLRELDEFHVSGSGEGSNIGGLKNLNHLQGSLRIKWLGDVKDPDEVKKAELKSKKNLTGLGLSFGSRTERGEIRDDEILEALEPPPNIDSLEISYYQGINQVLPSWFDKLKVVRLQNWGKMENLLPPLGKLPFLEELDVRVMESVRKVGREFLGMEADDSDISIGEMTPSNTITAFPSLKSLGFWDLENWEEWEGEGRRNEDKTIMPSLRCLRIVECPKLKALPDYIYQSTTLEKLEIYKSAILEEQFKEGGKGWPNTSHTPNITLKNYMYVGLKA